ncbi:hypothetical protein PR001_g12645 [Phytophthora rubi]|uniref:Transposase Tc1-like domain-containing protein n=1 Tax=Phytophthora rubi TaxID=129364 RepID=A0A6A3M484_9STRA|nr:hypothetical protein PR001_g12645 [Phytophthora rubi]
MGRTKGKADIPDATRQAIALFLAERSVNGRLKRGAAPAAAARFGCCRQQAIKIFKQKLLGLPAPTRGRPPASASSAFIAQRVARVSATPHRRRQTLRAMAHATNIPKTTLLRYISKKLVQRVTVRVKPTLSEDHKRRHLAYALAHVERPIGARLYRLHHMYDMIHIDEKWFNMYKATNTFYLTANETAPYTSSPNKRYIGKVMFLAAVARPRYDSHRKCQFDGKIGIWPIVEESSALRKSINRPKGAIVTKCVNMTRSVYVKMLKTKVLPAIRTKWPGGKRRVIFIQQDNASPHVLEKDEEIAAAGKEDGWDIRMKCQPARSPDMNVLDLGFFHSIQSLQCQEETYTIDQLIEAVARAFRTTTSDTLDHCFLTFQNVMETVIKHHGHNDYKLSHYRQRRGLLSSPSPTALTCEPPVVESGIRHLLCGALQFL